MPLSLTYRTTGAWGAGIGVNLTPTQVDTNFYTLASAVDTLQTSLPTAARSVESIQSSGTAFNIYLTDGTVQGPFTMPMITWNYRGLWQPSTQYYVGDIVYHGTTAYYVNLAHTSALTFDPNANDGSGHQYYKVILSTTQIVPNGGTTGQVLAKASNIDYALQWITLLLSSLNDVTIASPTTNDVLIWNGTAWANEHFNTYTPAHQIINGGAVGSHTVPGISTANRLDEVIYFKKITSPETVTDVQDLTAEFSISAANTITNSTTDTSNGKLLVRWSVLS